MSNYLQSKDCSPPGSSVHGDSPGMNIGVECHALQGFFQTQVLNLHFLCLLHWQAGSLPLAPTGKPNSAVREFKKSSVAPYYLVLESQVDIPQVAHARPSKIWSQPNFQTLNTHLNQCLSHIGCWLLNVTS